MPKFGNERGGILMFFALLIPLILAGLGLAVDNGYLYKMKRETQLAADATAIAAAQELRLGNSSNLESVALEDGALNGVTPGKNTSVSINRPPKAGLQAGNSNFVEVVMRREAPLFFWKAVTTSHSVVEARSVAGVTPAGASCLISMAPTQLKALNVSGKVHVELKNCGAHVNSSHNNAAQIDTGNCTFKASSISVVGKASSGPWQPEPEEQVPAISDPLAALAPPTYGACNFNGEYDASGTVTLNPGVYCGGIKATGTVTFKPGTYILAGGGMIVTNNARVRGEDVTFYNTKSKNFAYKKIEFSGTADAELSAPTGGAFKGILFMQDRKNFDKGERVEFGDNATLRFSGTFYFPNVDILFTDKVHLQNKETLFVANAYEFNDDARVEVNIDPLSQRIPVAFLNANLVE